MRDTGGATVVGRGRPAGPDGPDRLVRDDERLGRRIVAKRLELAREDLVRLSRVALLGRLADAVDRDEARLAAAGDLLREHRTVLAEEPAPFRVADDRVAAARVRGHGGRDLAGDTPPPSRRRRSGTRATSGPARPARRRAGGTPEPGRARRRQARHRSPGRAPRKTPAPRSGSCASSSWRRRDSRRMRQRSSASIPGSFPSARNSSEAPPPVETWVNFSATPAA